MYQAAKNNNSMHIKLQYFAATFFVLVNFRL